jgi:VanZ family protein
MLTKLMFIIPPVFRKILFLIYLLLVAWASLSSPKDMPRLISIPHIDLIAHFVMYFLFCVVGIWALDTRKVKPESAQVESKSLINESRNKAGKIIPGKAGQGWIYIIIFLFAITWGLAMELFQRAMHLGREYSMADLAANISGALFGAGLYYLLTENKD